jgi:hypothetical protein
VRRSKVEGVLKSFSSCASFSFSKDNKFPPNTGFGAEPQVDGFFGSVRAALKNFLVLDHYQVEFLGGDPSSLEPPQIDQQLPADRHDGFFPQCRIGAV